MLRNIVAVGVVGMLSLSGGQLLAQCEGGGGRSGGRGGGGAALGAGLGGGFAQTAGFRNAGAGNQGFMAGGNPQVMAMMMQMQRQNQMLQQQLLAMRQQMQMMQQQNQRLLAQLEGQGTGAVLTASNNAAASAIEPGNPAGGKLASTRGNKPRRRPQ